MTATTNYRRREDEVDLIGDAVEKSKRDEESRHVAAFASEKATNERAVRAEMHRQTLRDRSQQELRRLIESLPEDFRLPVEQEVAAHRQHRDEEIGRERMTQLAPSAFQVCLFSSLLALNCSPYFFSNYLYDFLY